MIPVDLRKEFADMAERQQLEEVEVTTAKGFKTKLRLRPDEAARAKRAGQGGGDARSRGRSPSTPSGGGDVKDK